MQLGPMRDILSHRNNFPLNSRPEIPAVQTADLNKISVTRDGKDLIINGDDSGLFSIRKQVFYHHFGMGKKK